MMCISLFSYGRPVVVRCMGVRLGMGWVGSWVHKFTWQWVGLGQLFGGLGWAGSMKIDPRTTLVHGWCKPWSHSNRPGVRRGISTAFCYIYCIIMKLKNNDFWHFTKTIMSCMCQRDFPAQIRRRTASPFGIPGDNVSVSCLPQCFCSQYSDIV